MEKLTRTDLTGFQNLTGLDEPASVLLNPNTHLPNNTALLPKVDELFAICDALKERINESQVTQLNLAAG